MRTVKEVSAITGVSVRTLHWYDKIGLLKPTASSEAGYRLYDDRALETLQQILFFREFDMPLKDIKAIMENPDLDRNQILRTQKKMLELKKEHFVQLISSIDGLLKGESRMDFEVFDKAEIEEMYQGMIVNLSGQQLRSIEEQYGSLEEYEKQYVENMGKPQAQEMLHKMAEWYGDKKRVRETASAPRNTELMNVQAKRVSAVLKKLMSKKGMDVSSFEVKQVIGEFDFVEKQIWQMKDVSKMMLHLAESYRLDEQLIRGIDEQNGMGTSDFIGRAIQEFYK